jgi:hypothetical protein
MLIVGNKNYGLASSIEKIYPSAVFYSRTTGYNLGKREIREAVAEHTLLHETTILVSALGDFSQVMLAEAIIKKWVAEDHNGYLIALGSSADTPVKGTKWIYPVEKKALRAYMRQLSQAVSSDDPPRWKSTYVSPGNMHTPRQDEKMPNTPKLDTDYVARIIKWLIEQPSNINVSELCLDRIQID